ncbi:hypothetical protein [Acetobacter conturbans]|uniref:Uncharacterized protein n=1 Tax=Acetobacter conturbans TaxID=1737472 RepID=A0ABX0JXY8_9PROT|nr:hypothetical protein [Acetobacter conturbans]NHN88214.1 hypothetical protein [Acetobacter conturbans]
MTISATTYDSLATLSIMTQTASADTDLRDGHVTGSDFGDLNGATLATSKFAFDSGEIQPSFILDISTAANVAMTSDTGTVQVSAASDMKVGVMIDDTPIYTVTDGDEPTSSSGDTLLNGVPMKDIKGATVSDHNYAYIYTGTSVTAVNLDSLSSQMETYSTSDSDDSALSSVITNVAAYLKSTHGQPGADTQGSSATGSTTSAASSETIKQTVEAQIALDTLNKATTAQSDLLTLFDVPNSQYGTGNSSTPNVGLSTKA